MTSVTPSLVLYNTVDGSFIGTLDRFYSITYTQGQGPTLFTVTTTLADTNVKLRDLVPLRLSAAVVVDEEVLLAGVLTPYGLSQTPSGDLGLTLTFSSPEILFQGRLLLPNPVLPLLDTWGAPVVPSRGFSVEGLSYLSSISQVYRHAMSAPGGGFPAEFPPDSAGPVTASWEPVDAFIVQEVVDSLSEEGGESYKWEPRYHTPETPVKWHLLPGVRTQTAPHLVSGNPAVPSIIDLTVDQDASSVYGSVFFLGGQVKDELALGYFMQELDPLTPLQELWDSSHGEEMSSTSLAELARAKAEAVPQVTWTGTLLDNIYQRDIQVGDQVVLDLSRTSSFPGYITAPLTCVAIEGEVGVQATKITLRGDYIV